MSGPASEVVYPRQYDTVYIERLAEPGEITDAHAYAGLTLLEYAYSDLFEKPGNGNEAGTFASAINRGSDARISQQKARMQEYVRNGSAYYFIRDADIPEFSLMALAKVSPSKSSRLQRAPNCYVNDIVVHPTYQNQGFSRMLLHTIAKYGGYDQKQYLALDAFTSHRVIRDWFERIGFREVTTKEPLALKVGEAELPLIRYSTEPHATIADVVRTLEENDEILRHASPRSA